jgi:hypothetical protein
MCALGEGILQMRMSVVKHEGRVKLLKENLTNFDLDIQKTMVSDRESGAEHV